ncbi:cell division protein ZapB [Desulforhabdus amnigena]|uniref:Uncharacterized protein n=1 Tax=Desulforhabdus amnigena TaxID=40218 RepID=A0A9W6FVX9_9BACT|nr:cell division protein ZapB [Desulforhabdus amnigena]NLJ26980.1 hypothetical protein [Deltaproteobacteria bacterium]GLI35844.1 hypothetical protein DAMNIGENAA_32770 [Desulforhabdus amnigena]
MDQLRRLEQEVEALKASVAQLQQEIQALRQEQALRAHPVEEALGQRGLPVFFHGDQSQIIFPPDFSSLQKERFYRLMRRYSFRLFLRELIQAPEGSDWRALNRYCSLKTVRSYMKELSHMNIVELLPDFGYRLRSSPIPSFGPTLEWYVCEIFRREFLAPALFNIRLRQTRFGGDYDVISIVAGYLVYVEVKSSPPRGVESPAVIAFLNRIRDLQPHMAIFLVDTELRMKDKMVPLFEEAFEREHRNPEEWKAKRLVNEIFQIRHAIYLINSRKGIYSNLRHCFRDFLSGERKIS